MALLTPRWEILRPHPVQSAYWHSPHRFNVVPAGRRSGKTELAKRKIVRRALDAKRPDARFFAAAPTRDQAKTIYWEALKGLIPRNLMAKTPSETDLSIRLDTGVEIRVVGMDKPQRIEGSPWDGGVLDEFANMKPGAWGGNIRPALADRGGWCDLIGVPEGRNHYFEIYQTALTEMMQRGSSSEWGAFTWLSASVLPEHEVASARNILDARTFRQEYEASFEAWAGVVIYAFDRMKNVKPQAKRDDLPIEVGMDFNVNPMTATVWQEIDGIDYQVGEVVIATSSTDEMADELTRRYARNSSVAHITIYPDPAGSQRRTSAQGETDISILRKRGFRVVAMDGHPEVRDRHNLTNAMFCAADGTRRAFVDPSCGKSITAYERLVYKEDTSLPDKTGGFDHAVDATGYRFYTKYKYMPARSARIDFMGR